MDLYRKKSMVNTISLCKRCGFILGTRPNLKNVDGICTACLNHDKKRNINFTERQAWLTDFVRSNKTNAKYDALVAVSGGKDSTAIVRKAFEHGCKKLLLVNVTEEFSHTKAGIHNLSNLVKSFNCDLITWRINPAELAEHMRNDLTKNLNPLKWLEEQIYLIPLEIAREKKINIVFYGENAEFEYGSSENLEMFHPASDDNLSVLYMGAVYPYAAQEWVVLAKEVGFLDLDHFNEWQRHGQIENYSQIDSIGYNMGVWTKFVKFGFQRVSDMACRYVRDGIMSYDVAQQYIREMDYICDPASKRDFCRTVDITEQYFDEMVDRHANRNLVVKDERGIWRRVDYL